METLIFAGGLKMEEEFYLLLHPEVRAVIVNMQKELRHPIRITEIGRSDDDSERIYMQIATRLLATNGVVNLHGVDLAQYTAIKDLSPMGVRQWARSRASWHKPFCGVDIGTAEWKVQDKDWAALHLHQACPHPMWEVITESHGTGPHIHLARRDYAWLKDFPGALRSAKGRKTAPRG